MSFLRALESVIGMFQSLPGMLVSSLVIFFPVVCGGSAVRVCGELVEFGSSLVRVIWHGVSLGFRCILDSFHFPRCPIRDTRPRGHVYTQLTQGKVFPARSDLFRESLAQRAGGIPVLRKS
jgi:hypothetical protein